MRSAQIFPLSTCGFISDVIRKIHKIVSVLFLRIFFSVAGLVAYEMAMQ